MKSLYAARWIVPITSAPFQNGALLVDGELIVAIGDKADLVARFPDARVDDLGAAAILPGLVNTHSHLELTAMRGFLEAEEADFFLWLRKLTIARQERLTADDLYFSAAWGACEAIRAGITGVADASDAAAESMKAIRDVGLRGIVYQESFGPDPRLAQSNLEILAKKIDALRELETRRVKVGISPHSPFTVSPLQLKLISEFATSNRLPVMMHVAESLAEENLVRCGNGPFADGLAKRGIEWQTPGVSIVQYLAGTGILGTKPLLAHCIRVDDEDVQTIATHGGSIAHCPKSNAKLSHGRAPFAKFLKAGIKVGLGSDSVASNNICDLLEESRFALLSARAAVSETEGGELLTAAE